MDLISITYIPNCARHQVANMGFFFLAYLETQLCPSAQEIRTCAGQSSLSIWCSLEYTLPKGRRHCFHCSQWQFTQ